MARPRVLQSIDQNALDIDILEAKMYEKLSAKQDLINGTEVTVLAKDEIKIGDIVYTVKGDTLEYNNDIYSDNGTTALSSNVFSVSFSPDGNTLVLGGLFTGYAKVYSVNGTTITYISDIYSDNGTTALNGEVYSISFSPDGNTLVLGGYFTGYAKVYSVNGNTITYVSNIYADNGTTALSSNVRSISFSPDGNTLVLGGYFTGYAKVYSVNGTTITYVSDIYSDNGTTALNDYVRSISFSPDGNTLVLGGNFTGYAKVYSVSGSTITYVSDIYSDNSNTVLSSNVWSISFSPDGNTLVLGGYFTGYAKVYSVSGTTITYVSNIYSDNNNTALDDNVFSVSFSPDGNTLVLGGYFTGYAKVYTWSKVAYLTSNPEFDSALYDIAIAQENISLNAKGIIRKIISVDNSQLSKKPLTASSILSSSGWDGNVYSFESDFPKSIYDIEIEINGDNCTSEQLEAWSGAQLVGSATSNSCKAMGDVPTIDIPIIIKVVVK